MYETNKVAICPSGIVNNSQNVPCGLGLINPYTGLPLNPSVADKSYMDALTRMEAERIKVQLDMEKQRLDYACKRDLEMLKAENRLRLEEKQAENNMKRIEGMRARAEERENASYAIFKDSESKLRLEIKYPTRKSNYSEPVINSVNMRACRICDAETQKTVAVIFLADNLTENIVLKREEVNPKAFEKCLSERGLAITTSRERRKVVVELLLSYLIDEAAVVELPKKVGWSKTNTGWFFAESESETIKGVLKEGYGIK